MYNLRLFYIGGSPGEIGEVPVPSVKQRKDYRMICGVGEDSFSNPYIASPTSQLIVQPFRRFTYVTGHSTTLPLLHLRQSHFTWRSAQVILQYSYVYELF